MRCSRLWELNSIKITHKATHHVAMVDWWRQLVTEAGTVTLLTDILVSERDRVTDGFT